MLYGKVAVVTGAGRGIGREVALLMASRGARVVVNDLGTATTGEGQDNKVADEVVAEIRGRGGEAVANYDAVGSWAAGQSIVASALDHFGRLDILVNCAGILRDRMFFNMTEEEWDAVITVHLKGTFACCRAAAPHFKGQKYGRVINFTSTSGLIGNLGQANYAAAKLGIWGLTKSIALDMARYNVTANAIAPFAWTRMIGTIPTDLPEQAARVDILKQLSPAFVATTVCFLASEAAQGVTGQIFAVRGREVVLMGQSRPLRSLIHNQGWTPEELAQTLPGAFQRDMYPLDVTADIFNYDPLV